jgi:hypothetical protein
MENLDGSQVWQILLRNGSKKFSPIPGIHKIYSSLGMNQKNGDYSESSLVPAAYHHKDSLYPGDKFVVNTILPDQVPTGLVQ